MASIGVPAAIRPMTGTTTGSTIGSPPETGRTRPRLPSMTLGEKPRARGAAGVSRFGQAEHLDGAGAVGQALMKPRSSSALISRWMPDFDRRSRASFISSKDGGTPDSFSRS